MHKMLKKPVIWRFKAFYSSHGGFFGETEKDLPLLRYKRIYTLILLEPINLTY